MNWELKEAYEQTISDFEIALRNSFWWEFKLRKNLRSRIKEYEDKIDKMLIKSGQLNI